MANKPISMSKIRHELQFHSQGRSKLLISQQTGIARNTIKKYIKEFDHCGLSFKEINELSDKDLEDLFIRPDEKPLKEKHKTLFNLFPVYDKELRKKGITRQILWVRYKQEYPDGVGRSQFNTILHNGKNRLIQLCG